MPISEHSTSTVYKLYIHNRYPQAIYIVKILYTSIMDTINLQLESNTFKQPCVNMGVATIIMIVSKLLVLVTSISNIGNVL